MPLRASCSGAAGRRCVAELPAAARTAGGLLLVLPGLLLGACFAGVFALLMIVPKWAAGSHRRVSESVRHYCSTLRAGVDAYQGREKDVILLSSVRSDRGRKHSQGIGFLRDARRMNVSITRARSSVFVLGHVETLKEEPLWEAVVHDASERQCLLRAHSPIITTLKMPLNAAS